MATVQIIRGKMGFPTSILSHRVGTGVSSTWLPLNISLDFLPDLLPERGRGRSPSATSRSLSSERLAPAKRGRPALFIEQARAAGDA